MSIVYHTHQGLGDLIVCSPIVNYIADTTNKQVILVVKSHHHLKNIRRFCLPKIEIKVLDNYDNSNFEKEIKVIDDWSKLNNFSVIRSGFKNYYYDPKLPWDFSFYASCGIPYDIKSSYFWIDKNKDLEKEAKIKLGIHENEQYIFVHEDSKRNLRLNIKTSLKIVKNDESIDIATMSTILENSNELHMIGSSLMCLADVLKLPTQGQTAYYYNSYRDLNFRGRENWKFK